MGIFLFQKNKAIYFRITKTASSSILINLRKYDKLEKIPDEEYGKKYEDYFKFTFVRNPFDRLASAYRHLILRHSVGTIYKNKGIYKNMPFDEFVKILENIPLKHLDIHFKPQYTFLEKIGDFQRIKPPKNNIFIGRFENLQEDYNKVCEIIGLPKEILPCENSTGDKTDYSIYDKEITKKVIRIYEKDFDLFGYSKIPKN